MCQDILHGFIYFKTKFESICSSIEYCFSMFWGRFSFIDLTRQEAVDLVQKCLDEVSILALFFFFRKTGIPVFIEIVLVEILVRFSTFKILDMFCDAIILFLDETYSMKSQ